MFSSKLLQRSRIISGLFYVILLMANIGPSTEEVLNKNFMNECCSRMHEAGVLLNKEF